MFSAVWSSTPILAALFKSSLTFRLVTIFSRVAVVALFTVATVSCAESQEPAVQLPVESLQLPLNRAELGMPAFEHFDQRALQFELDKCIAANAEWAKLVAAKKMAVAVVDLSNLHKISYAQANGNEMMYAASLPKIAVLLASMDALEKKELKETPQVKADMKAMISRSDNEATTRMMDLLGFDKIASIMRSDAYKLYDEHGGLWVGKRYAKDGPRVGDPLKNISHGATVEQVCRFYYMMLCGELVSSERSAQMLDIMENPELHHKFVNTLDRVAPGARVFRKSGTWSRFHADSVLVWDPKSNRRYILVALIEDERGESFMRQLVVPVEEAMKRAQSPATAQLP